MTTDTLIILIGTLVALLPFLGFPVAIDMVLLIIAGISIIALGISIRRRSGARVRKEHNEVFAGTESPRSDHESI